MELRFHKKHPLDLSSNKNQGEETMGFFDKLFDKREKKRYLEGCHFFYSLATMQKVEYSSKFNDITAEDYRANIVGIVAAYLDTKPKEHSGFSTFGQDMFWNETGCVSNDVKEKFFPKCKEKRDYFAIYIKNNLSNNLNASNSRLVAIELCKVNSIPQDESRIREITNDINKMIELVDATLSTFRFL